MDKVTIMANSTLRLVETSCEQALDILRDIYKKASVVNSGKYYTSVNELCDQIPALRPGTLKAAVTAAMEFGTFGATKLLSEEDKGATIATAYCLSSGLPLCIARWYPYQMEGQVEVDIKSEYFNGSLYLNGIEKGDKVLIIEDTLSTGGTMIALINAVRKAGADVVGAIAIVEKEANEGHDNVWLKTGIDVKTCIKVDVTKDGVAILS